jgi:carbonic anhydrase
VAPNREAFLLSVAGAFAGGLLLPEPAPAANAKPPMSAQAALKNLMDGNARFVAGTPKSRPALADVTRLSSGQTPFATVLGCADSRVPVETIFDHDPGDIFVVRLAGNFVSDAALGSIEYGTAVLKSPLIVVLGHTSCGAVKAGIDFLTNHEKLPGHMQVLADAVLPAAKASQHQHGDWWHNAVAENVRLNVSALKSSTPIIAQAIAHGEVEVVGGVYELHSGKVVLV